VPSCTHRPPCAACPRFAEPGIATEAAASLDELAKQHGVVRVPVISGRMSQFRLRARLAIRGRLGAPKIGLFEAGTHRVVHIPNCPIHHPLINRVAGVVRRALVDAGITCYSDQAHLGLARYLQVVVERRSQTAQVVLVGNSPTAAPFAACLDLIRDRLGTELHSLWFNSNCGHNNTILGAHFELWCGPVSVTENFGGAAVHYPPGAFGQNNLEIAEQMIEHLRGEIPQGSRVSEFYAGVGAIGLSIVGRSSVLYMNEVSPPSLAGLDLGLADLDALERDKIMVFPGPAGAAHRVARGAGVVIVDPPRKGLDSELIDALRDSAPERLLYVSCSLASFREDVVRLTGAGNMQLRALTAFNLMPFTEHVETIGRFERAS
jgi:tRNA/tmRNA/rRNA uracil-C5-methylase (TrmA/RlmC/RlmD family)